MRIYQDSTTNIAARAAETRKRRQAAGRYPTPEQKEAAKRLTRRDGWKNITREDATLLATHPYFSESQREQFAAMVAAQ